MSRVALDSNVLVYAELEPDSAKGNAAADIIARAAHDGVIPVQVLGEFLRVVQRRMPAAFEEAVKQSELYQAVFLTPPTTNAVLAEASHLALGHKLQVWDSVICAAALQAQAEILFTEDLQDGFRIGRLKLLNPFAAANTAAVDSALRR